MKKLILSLILLANMTVFAQLPITQDFGTTAAVPSGWTLSGDWIVDPSQYTTGLFYDCDVSGSSGNSKLFAINSSGGQSTATYTFSGTGKTSITISWNEFRDDNSLPVLTVLTSTDNFVTSTTLTVSEPPATDYVTTPFWGSVSGITLPSSFDNQASIQLRFLYTADNSGLGIGIDDISITGTSAPIYYWKGSGNLDVLSNWGDNSDGSGTAPSNFTNDGQIFNIVNGTSATIGSNWTVTGIGSAVKVGDGTTWNVNFTIPSTNYLTLTNAQLIVNSSSTLTLQHATNYLSASSVSLSTNSTVDFAQSSAVNLWSGGTFENLTISGGGVKSCSGANTINGILNLNGTNLQMAANQNLTMNGTLTGSGSLVAALGNMVIGGTGAFGTLKFSVANPSIRNFTLNRSGNGTVILGSNLTFAAGGAGNVALTAGVLDLNGKLLTISRGVTFSSATIKGSTTSSLSIAGSGAISGSMLMDQTSSSTRSLYDFTLNRSGQTLTVGNSLEIINSITPTLGTIASGGNVKLIASSSRSARVGTVGGAITGNVTVQTYAASSGTTGWTNLSPSGVSGLTIANWDGQFPMTCTGCTNGPSSAGGYFVSVQGANEAGTGGTEYVELTSSSALTPGTGYWIYLGTGASSTSPITITETGSVSQGTVNVSLTKSGGGQNGYNLVSNPYPSPITWTAVAADASNTMIDGSAYLYSPVGGQITLNGSGSATPGGYVTNGVIPMGQGFYVFANSAGTMKFKETHKSTANTSANPLLKTANASNEFRLSIAGPYAAYDEALFIFDNNATTSFDRLLDAYKVYSTPGYAGYPGTYSQYTTINSISNNEDYAINALPLSPITDLVVPIRAKAMVTGSYTISPMSIQNLPAGSCVILKDKLLNVNHDLRSGAYVFNMADTTSAPRFELTICAGAITTSVSNLSEGSDVLITQDQNGPFVKTHFSHNTKAVITAYNLMGQKVMADKEIEGTDVTSYLDINVHNQIVIVKVVSSDNVSTVKRIYIQ